MEKYEVIIIGGGPAGVSAGIYVLRAGLKPVVFDTKNSALKKAKNIQNYYGIGSRSGEELLKTGVNQYKKLGGTYRETED